jgi:hypothetical protein
MKFFWDKLLPGVIRANNTLLVMDNLSSHHAEKLQRMLDR